MLAYFPHERSILQFGCIQAAASAAASAAAGLSERSNDPEQGSDSSEGSFQIRSAPLPHSPTASCCNAAEPETDDPAMSSDEEYARLNAWAPFQQSDYKSWGAVIADDRARPCTLKRKRIHGTGPQTDGEKEQHAQRWQYEGMMQLRPAPGANARLSPDGRVLLDTRQSAQHNNNDDGKQVSTDAKFRDIVHIPIPDLRSPDSFQNQSNAVPDQADPPEAANSQPTHAVPGRRSSGRLRTAHHAPAAATPGDARPPQQALQPPATCHHSFQPHTWQIQTQPAALNRSRLRPHGTGASKKQPWKWDGKPQWRPHNHGAAFYATHSKDRMANPGVVALVNGTTSEVMGSWEGMQLWEELFLKAEEAGEELYDSDDEEWQRPQEDCFEWEGLAWSPDGSCFAVHTNMHLFLFSFMP